MTTLEALARDAWIRWGAHYAQFTVCARCREWRYCRSRGGRRWICLDCHAR